MPFSQPDFTTQDPATYKANLDGAVKALAHLGAGFSPRATTPASLQIQIDAGAMYDRGQGGFYAQEPQLISAIAPPLANSKVVRVYVDQSGLAGVVEGATAAAPAAPDYPAGVWPICRFVVASGQDAITDEQIIDERSFATGFGASQNTFLITSSMVWTPPVGAKFMRLTGAAPGGGAGAGCTNAAGASHAGGGGAGAGASIFGRLMMAEAVAIVMGAPGLGGIAALTNGLAGTVATDGGTTTITGQTTGQVISMAGGVKGGASSPATPTAGAAGTGGVAGTGVAGGAGAVGTIGAAAVGGKGGDVGPSGTTAKGGLGATVSDRKGKPGKRGSGGGGGVGATGDGGQGGESFILIEVF